MSRRVLIDLLAVRAGGQVTRARSFLRLLREFDASSQVTVVRRAGSVQFIDGRTDLDVIDVALPDSRLGSIYRMGWENVVLAARTRLRPVDVFLTFSHYLPRTLPSRLQTIVGVSNLAPFSEVARRLEPWGPGKLRLLALRRTIVSSARRADRVMALSRACRDVLVAEGISPEKITVIPNGVEPVAAVETESGVGQVPSPFVLYVSHFYRYKNFENLILGYARLPDALRDKYHLVLVGRPLDRGYFEDVRSLVGKLGLDSRVHIVPGVDRAELGQLYRSASAFAFPSYIENCPNILLEAMQYGAPVVVSSVPPMPEFGGDAALYFDPSQPAEVGSALERVLTDAALQQELRRRAEQRAGEYSWERFTRDVVDLYVP